MTTTPLKYITLLLIAATLILSACGGDGEKDGESGSDSAESKVVETLDGLSTAMEDGKSVSAHIAGDANNVTGVGLAKVISLPEDIQKDAVSVDGETATFEDLTLTQSGDSWKLDLPENKIAAAVAYQFDIAMHKKDWDRAKNLATDKSGAAIEMVKSLAQKDDAKESDPLIKDLKCEVKEITEAEEGQGEDTAKAAEGEPKTVKIAECKGCCNKKGESKTYKVKHEGEVWLVEFSKGADK